MLLAGGQCGRRPVEYPSDFLESQTVTVKHQGALEILHIEDDVTEIVVFHVVTPRYPIGISAPFIWLASLDARKIKVCAMDSGLTHLDGSASGMLLRFAGVSMVVGRTPLTVTFDPVSSSERARIRATRPDFDTMYAAAPGNGSSAAPAATCTMRPIRRS